MLWNIYFYVWNIYISNNYGVSWSLINIGILENIYQDVSLSQTGQYQTIITRGYSIYTSDDYGVTWINKNIIKKWTVIKMSGDSTKQYAIVNQESKIYYSTD